MHLSHAVLDNFYTTAIPGDIDAVTCAPIEDNPGAKYCDITAPGNWFIIVDASWFSYGDEHQSSDTTKRYYQEQKHIAEKMIDYISEINRKEINSDDKHEICVILATNNKIEIVRKLCGNKTVDDKLPHTVTPTTEGISPEEILDEVDEQPTYCNWRPNRQRFVVCECASRRHTEKKRLKFTLPSRGILGLVFGKTSSMPMCHIGITVGHRRHHPIDNIFIIIIFCLASLIVTQYTLNLIASLKFAILISFTVWGRQTQIGRQKFRILPHINGSSAHDE
uniref:Uncharacterized protein n=1 Tax=Romanomermis culicivorax TaxID=13658 RepID=A0A915HSN4_ROMCU